MSTLQNIKNKKTLILSLLLLACAVLPPIPASAATPWFFTSKDINALHSEPADYKIPYGKDPSQFGELRLPSGPGPYPVVIIIHGGCWRSKLANLHNTSALADALRDLGYATWNIEYRGEDNTGGGWPGTFNDVAAAVDFLPAIATQYLLDLNHVVAVGHSAGGELVLWLAGRHNLPAKSPLYSQHPLHLRGVLALGGVPDLQAYRHQGEAVCGADVVGNLLGNSEDIIATHYKEASPVELLPLGVPQILIYGSADHVVPEQLGQNYIQAAKKKGDKAKLIDVKDAGHHEYLAPNSDTWPAVKSSIENLMQNQAVL